MSVHRLESTVLHYDWGSRSAIADVLARAASGKPEAEFWMGAHPKASSRLEIDGRKAALQTLIEEEPARWLGSSNHERFGSRLPFLFKVLAAERPLSLQVHPTLEQARRGFAAEESRNLAPDAVERAFPDPSHKPELVCAVGAFEALVGFRRLQEGLAALSEVGLGRPEHPLFSAFCAFLNDASPGGLRRFCGDVLAASDEVVRRAVDASVEVAARSETDASRLLSRLAAEYPADPGVLLALLLNPVRLAPGEALFLPAGVVHAYLGGVALEVMASSDNVLRLGLTTKPLHRGAVLELAQFEPHVPSSLVPTARSNGDARELRYSTPAPEFDFALLEMPRPGGETFLAGPALFLVLEGHFEVDAGGTRLSLVRGEHAFLEPSPATLRGHGRIARVIVNPSS